MSKPKLGFYLPHAYSTDPDSASQQNVNSSGLRVVTLNDEISLNQKVIEFWKNGAYQRIVNKEHPYLKVTEADIEYLQEGLNSLLSIYYVSGLTDSTQENRQKHWHNAIDSKCIPLSNHEIQFLMNANAENAFPRVPYTMLIISAHELMMQKGGQPIFPKVYSAYLHKRFQLVTNNNLFTEANLFFDKTAGKSVYLRDSGFIFCRK